MYSGLQAAEGWGVRPGSGPQASKQLDCRPQQRLACRPQQQLARQRAPPIPEEQPLTQNELPGFLAGYKAGYYAAYFAGWEQGYHAGEIDTLQMQQDEQDQGYQTNRRGASPDWWEEDEHGYCDGGDKKKQKYKKNQAIQWAERYNMGNPVNLKEFPRVEFWADTKREAYNEDIQQEIRGHLTTNGGDLT